MQNYDLEEIKKHWWKRDKLTPGHGISYVNVSADMVVNEYSTYWRLYYTRKDNPKYDPLKMKPEEFYPSQYEKCINFIKR